MDQSMIGILRCPLCGGAFSRRENSLVCCNRHCYDIARQGHINFVPGQKEMFYKKELFESRAEVFRAGVYAPVIERLSQALARHVPEEHPVIVDAGCGEGYYIKSVCPDRAMTRVGFDLSKDAVRLAARGQREALFFAADLKRIPLADGCADAVLDIFTPADYAQFKRILKPQGLLFKLAPRSGYLRELRAAAGGFLRRKEYDGGDVERYARERMNVVASETITYTLGVAPETVAHLARMTPMLAGIDIEKLDLSGVEQITIDETLIIGSIK
ncbi:MAG: methyltransferase domain-containing protein [Clostridia bacterium]|nr:methyltransferase domain-containing protein [Clostridia bacterium]MBQ4608848.1 methyltransferase domain-containing protein [Clostridia bacterium]MBQ6859509.1 methyltransferase domain-containing protein [Clostridia bacterium]